MRNSLSGRWSFVPSKKQFSSFLIVTSRIAWLDLKVSRLLYSDTRRFPPPQVRTTLQLPWRSEGRLNETKVQTRNETVCSCMGLPRLCWGSASFIWCTYFAEPVINQGWTARGKGNKLAAREGEKLCKPNSPMLQPTHSSRLQLHGGWRNYILPTFNNVLENGYVVITQDKIIMLYDIYFIQELY